MRFKALIILGCMGILNHQATAVPDLITGAIVEPIGHSTILVEGILKLNLRFQAPQRLYDQIIHYQIILKDLGQAISNLTNLKPTYERLFIGTELARMLNIEMEMLKSKIETLLTLDWIKPIHNVTKASIDANLTTNSANRTKRGAFDLGGIFLGSLFGLATEGNLQLVDKKIDVVAEAVKTSNTAMIQLSHDQKYIRQQIVLMKQQLYKHGHTVEVFEHMQWLNDRYVLFKFQLLTMEKFFDFLLNLDEEINALIAGAQGNSLHIIPKTLFPFDMFKKLNEATEDKLNMKSVAPLTRKTFPYYLNAARIFPGREHMTMLMVIPYASDKIYNTYKFHSFPTFHKEIRNYRVMLKFRLPYMLISNNLKSITHLDENDFKLCNHVFTPVSIYLCFLSHTLYDFPLSNSVDLAPHRCQETIIRKNTAEECSFSPYTSNETIVKRVGQRIYLSSVAPLQAVVNCPSGNTQPLLKEVTILSPGCSFSSTGVSLLNFQEVRGDMLVQIPSKEIPIFSALDFSERFPLETANFTPVISFTDHDALISNQIEESERLLEKSKGLHHYASHIAVGISLTTVLVISAVFAYLCYHREPRYVKLTSRTARTLAETRSPILPRANDDNVEMHRVVYFKPFPSSEILNDRPFNSESASSYSVPRPGSPRPTRVTFKTPKSDEEYVDMETENNPAPIPTERSRVENTSRE